MLRDILRSGIVIYCPAFIFRIIQQINADDSSLPNNQILVKMIEEIYHEKKSNLVFYIVF